MLDLYNPWMGSSRGHGRSPLAVEAAVSFCLEHPQVNPGHGLKQSRDCEHLTFGAMRAEDGARFWRMGWMDWENS